jgi:hypothetical protein
VENKSVYKAEKLKCKFKRKYFEFKRNNKLLLNKSTENCFFMSIEFIISMEKKYLNIYGDGEKMLKSLFMVTDF